ncbi:DUF6207 family protein [Streptomyces sp. NPDC058463]|uniref:DUF6207 family protein n=1 Tax=Streptomyces sp. NPDC058463 TaxID=3346510 RepID=UPI0036482051
MGTAVVGTVMEPIDAQHISEPCLVVLDITAADETTALAAMAALELHWATSGVGPVRREPGAAGVKARIYADTRRRPCASA